MTMREQMFHVPKVMASDGACAAQYAALCWRLQSAQLQVLLITSRDTGRWVLPKGWAMEGRSAAQAAEREAWEEAGVIGAISPDSIGWFHYDKQIAGAKAVPCRVEVFALRVASLSAKFPERKQRQRKWFGAPEVAELVAEPELRALLADLPARMAAEIAAAPLAGGHDQDHIKG